MRWGLLGVQRRLLGLLKGVVVLLSVQGCGSSSPHSLRYFYMGVSEPSKGLPQFIAVGYVDDQPISRYDSITKRAVPGVPWMETVEWEKADYWEGATQNKQSSEAVFRISLEILRSRYNQSRGGLRVWQRFCGCEVWPDGQFRGGHEQYAYDGEDFIALDRETLTWTAPVPQAQLTKARWEEKLKWAQRINAYLENECVEWLRKVLDYDNKTLLRTEKPILTVAHKKGYNGRETLVCQLYGFYPKKIEVTWMKDGEDQKPETLTGGVVPNSDGTYNTWLSIDVDPEEKNRYQCRVGHNSLLEPLDLAWEDPLQSLWEYRRVQVLHIFTPLAILMVTLVFVFTFVFIFYWRAHRLKCYRIAQRKRSKMDYEGTSTEATSGSFWEEDRRGPSKKRNHFKLSEASAWKKSFEADPA